jgi:nitrite reductase/ring-hydroxylating ferredoxin subunit
MIVLCATSDVPVNGCKHISRGRRGAVLAFNLDGQFYVTDARCTHGAAVLAAGRIHEGRVFCPLHDGSFDIATGAPVDPPCDIPLKTYRVQLMDEQVMIDAEA